MTAPATVLAASLLSCVGAEPKASSSAEEQFVGKWTQTHGSYTGTCLGTVQSSNNGFTLEFQRSATGTLEIESPNGCSSSFTVTGNTATLVGRSVCTLPLGSTDPITLETTTTSSVVVTFTSDVFTIDGSTMHESVQATHDDGNTTCTFAGEDDYASAR